MSKCYDNPEYDDLGNGLQNTWEHSPLKDEQKQHLIDMMNNDKDLGLYNETFDEYLIRLKDRRTEDNYDYYTDEELELYNDYIMDCWRCGMSVYKCLEFMYFAEKEIQPEEIWNEEKMEGIKQLIQDNREETLEEAKDLNYWKNNAEEDYLKVPISVLRYITELEKQQERSYSEEEVNNITQQLRLELKAGVLKWQDDFEFDLEEWFEQFKNK